MQTASLSERTILVMSPAFLGSRFTKSEWAAAFSQDPDGLKRKVVPVRVAECEPSGLLSSIVYIDLVNLEETKAIEALRKYLASQRLKPSSQPVFPASPSPFPAAPRSTSESVVAKTEQRRFLHAQIGAKENFEIRQEFNPYMPDSDPTDGSLGATPTLVHAYVFFPHPDYFRSALKQFTPVAAFCTTDPAAGLRALRESLGDDRLRRLTTSPSNWMSEEKESLIRGIAAASKTSFVASVSVPAFVLSHSRERPYAAYDALANLFLLPLVGMHRALGIRAFQVRLGAVGDCGADLVASSKRILKAANGGGRTFNVDLADGDSCYFCGIARLVAYCVGLHYNSNSDKWVRLLEDELK